MGTDKYQVTTPSGYIGVWLHAVRSRVLPNRFVLRGFKIVRILAGDGDVSVEQRKLMDESSKFKARTYEHVQSGS
jgi:hypothetical protein